MKTIISILLITFSAAATAQVLTIPEPPKYDVELEINKFIVSNVKDGDGTEDLYGKLDCSNLKIEGIPVSAFDYTSFWVKSESETGGINSFRNGSHPIEIRHNVIKNLSKAQLKNLEITIGGELYDDEGIAGSRIFRCTSCSDQPPATTLIVNGQYTSNFRERAIRFIEKPATLSSIDGLVINDEFQKLKGDTGDFFEMRFWESGIKNDGYVRTMWIVWVKPHN